MEISGGEDGLGKRAVVIDGCDIRSLKLDELRSRLAIIPQVRAPPPSPPLCSPTPLPFSHPISLPPSPLKPTLPTSHPIALSIISLDSPPPITLLLQDPVLFNDSVRYNLDPFNQSSGEQLWAVLKKCEMHETVAALEGGLDHKVSLPLLLPLTSHLPLSLPHPPLPSPSPARSPSPP